MKRPRTRHHGFGRNRRETRPAGVTRRRFLQGTAGAAGLWAGSNLLLPAAARAVSGGRGAKVVRAHHPGATTGTTVNQGPVDLMVHLAVQELTGVRDTAAAWLSLFPGITTASRVAIKINLACGDVPTHPEVVNAIIDGLLAMDLGGGASLPEENIIVWDYDNPFFCPQTGYTPNWGGSGVQYVGTTHGSVGHDMGYTFTMYHPNSRTTTHHPSRIITDYCDYMINAAVIKDHSDSGVTMCLKNHYGSFDGVSSWYLHVYSAPYGDGHTRGEPELNRILRDELGDKTKLFLVDGTLGLYDGGPGYTPPGHTPPNWAYNSILVGNDPVAIDRVGTEKINEERIAHGLGVLDPSHVAAAAQAPYNLGTDDLGQIDLVEFDASTTDVPAIATGTGTALLSPYPNPTRGASTLRFGLVGETDVEIEILDVRGRRVRRLAAGRYPGGTHRVPWDGRDEGGRAVAAGVYFCRLRAAGRTHRRQIVVVR